MLFRHLRTIALALCASLALLAGCGNAVATSGNQTAAGPIKLAPLCATLTGLNGNLTPTGTYGPDPTKDGEGVAIKIPATPPQRIISLTPTDSEIIAALGASDRLVGIDHFTDYPTDILGKPVVTTVSGYTSSVDIEKVLSLTPDLVLDYGAGTFPTADATLRKAGINVISLPAGTLTGTLENILFTGKLLGATQQANTLVARMEKCIATIKQGVQGKTPISAYMEIDYSVPGKPYTVGQGSFENELIADAGGANIFATNASNGGYPQVSDETVIAANPQAIFLAEPVPPSFLKPQDRPAWKSVAAVQSSSIFVVDDNLLSRAGPRIVQGLAAVAEDLWPNLFS